MNDRDAYANGYYVGWRDAAESPDPTWHPEGASSEYERGYNAGYNDRVGQR